MEGAAGDGKEDMMMMMMMMPAALLPLTPQGKEHARNKNIKVKEKSVLNPHCLLKEGPLPLNLKD